MIDFPSSDDSFIRLQRAGWTVGDAAVHTVDAVHWMVSGTTARTGLKREELPKGSMVADSGTGCRSRDG